MTGRTIYRYGLRERIAREVELGAHARWQTARMHSAIDTLAELRDDPSLDDPGYVDALGDAIARLVDELAGR